MNTDRVVVVAVAAAAAAAAVVIAVVGIGGGEVRFRILTCRKPLSVLNIDDLNFCVRSTPLWETKSKATFDMHLTIAAYDCSLPGLNS